MVWGHARPTMKSISLDMYMLTASSQMRAMPTELCKAPSLICRGDGGWRRVTPQHICIGSLLCSRVQHVRNLIRAVKQPAGASCVSSSGSGKPWGSRTCSTMAPAQPHRLARSSSSDNPQELLAAIRKSLPSKLPILLDQSKLKVSGTSMQAPFLNIWPSPPLLLLLLRRRHQPSHRLPRSAAPCLPAGAGAAQGGGPAEAGIAQRQGGAGGSPAGGGWWAGGADVGVPATSRCWRPAAAASPLLLSLLQPAA